VRPIIDSRPLCGEPDASDGYYIGIIDSSLIPSHFDVRLKIANAFPFIFYSCSYGGGRACEIDGLSLRRVRGDPC
jgi:hypothetical protein